MPLIKRGSHVAPAAVSSSSATPSQLVSGSANERWAAARTMGGDAGAVPVLAMALAAEQAPEVREAIFTSLVRIRTSEAAAALTSIIRSDDAQLRTGALDALGAMMDVTRPLLPALLCDADPDVRLLACELVRPLDPGEGTKLLCAMLETEQQPNVCGAAVDVLSEAGLATAAAVLQRCATRFAADPYLKFAIADAIERVSKRPARNE